MIENISRGGCLCVIETFSTDKKPLDNLLNHTIPFRCHFPGANGEISFMGEIKNTRKKADELSVGVRFLDETEPDDVRRVINNYVALIETSGENV